MNHILIIDDDQTLAELLQKLFNNNGFKAIFCTNPKNAQILLEYISFDALIVDHMMVEQNGIEFLQDIREKNIIIPALMLTAVDEINNKISALTNLADDYVNKPFNSQELILRVKNLIKKQGVIAPSETVNIGALSFNMTSGALRIDNKDIVLSSLELDIFKILAKNINKPLDKEEILIQLGRHINETNLSSLNVSIMRLRKKIEDTEHPKYIKTLRGKGIILVSG